jgi:AsmA protein
MKLHRLLLALAVAVGLLVTAVVLLLASFDPQRYAPELAAWVKARTGRDLVIDGPLRFTLWPQPRVETGRLSLSERDGGGSFASVANARLTLALLPLLRGVAVIEDARLEAPKLDLRVRADGTPNFDDLFAPGGAGSGDSKPGAAESGPTRRIALDRLQIEGGEVHWRDDRNGTDLRVLDMQARFGRLGRGAAGDAQVRGRIVGTQPRLALALEGDGKYRLSSDGGIAVSGLDAKARGNVDEQHGEAVVTGDLEWDDARSTFGVRDFRLDARSEAGLELEVLAPKLRIAPEGAASERATATVRKNDAARSVNARLVLSGLRSEGGRMALESASLDGTWKAGDAAYEAKLASPVMLDLEAGTAELASLSGTLQLATTALGREPVVAPISGSMRGSWAGGRSAAAKLETTLEGAAIRGSFEVEDWAKRRVRAELDADRLELDRYLPTQGASAKSGAGGSAPAPGGAGGEPAQGPRPTLDFASLQDLDFVGAARIGSLTARGVKVEKLDLGVRVREGRVDVQPMAAVLYGGTTTGSASLDIGANRWHLSQQLHGVEAGPLLLAMAKFDRLEGRGNAAVELEATGDTREALVRSLRGTARFALAGGAIVGIDLAEVLRQASVALGSKTALEREARPGDRTSFSELSASFVIRDGIGTTKDLTFRSDAARASGGGRLDLVAGTVDYKLDATLLGVSTDVRNRVIARIGEVSVPVRVTGPIESPKYSVDVAGFAAAAAANELRRRAQGGNEGRKDPVRDLLRGLFGK